MSADHDFNDSDRWIARALCWALVALIGLLVGGLR